VTTDRIRVLVVDDHAVVREGIRAVLEDADDLEVVADASDGEEAIRLVESYSPNVVILDITMPGKSGLEVAQTLSKSHPTARLLILSIHDHAEYVLGAVRAGASGYLLKDSGPAELREAVRAVHDGRQYLCPRVAGQLTAALRGELEAEEDRRRLIRLTDREKEVLVKVAQGRTSREIAEEFGISPRTVETHRESLMKKLKIRSVAGLTRFAVEKGLLDD
jgi:DNA-binding NarL/FixJ family response regulator